MKLILSLLIASLFASSLLHAADDPEIKKQVQAKADESMQAFMKGDYAKLCDLTYPPLVEKCGGREKMIEAMKQSMEDMKAQGIIVKSTKVDEPKEVLPGGTDLFALLAVTMVMEVPKGTVTAKDATLGISKDNGKTWTFIRISGMEESFLRELAPSLPKNFKIPPRQPPVFEKKAEAP